MAAWDNQVKHAPTSGWRLDDIGANSPGVIFQRVQHPDGRIEYTYLSAAVRRLFGMAAQAVLADASLLLQAVHPDDRSSFEATLTASGANVAPWALEFRTIDKTGTTRWISGSAAPQRMEDGCVVWDGLCIDITQNRQTEDQLQNDQARLNNFASITADWFFEFDADLRYIYVSPSLSKSRDVAPEWLYGKKFEEIFDSAPLHETQLELVRMFRAHQTIRNHVFLRRLEGQEDHWIRTSAQPIYSTDGAFEGFRGSSTDITDQMVTEQALRLSERRFKDFSEVASDWYWETDENHRFIYNSENNSRYFGPSWQHVVGRTRIELRHQTDTDDSKWDAHLLDLKARQPLRDFIYTTTDSAGGLRYVKVNGKPVYDDDGNFLGYRGTGSDITELRSRDYALRESEQRFRSLVEGSVQGIIVQRNFDYLFANQESTRILGYESLEELRAAGSLIQHIHPEDRERLKGYAAGRLRGEPAPISYEARALNKEGGVVWLEVRTTIVEWDGEPAVQSVFYDISERKEAEEALTQSEARAEEARALLVDAIESLSEGFALFDEDDCLVMVNHQFLNYYKSANHLFVPGTKVEDIVHGTADLGLVPNAYDNKEEWVRERLARHRNPSGPFEQRLAPDRWLLINEHKTSSGSTVTVFTDITKLKRTERELRDHDRRLTSLVENAGVGIAEVGLDGFYRNVNAKLSEITGYRRDELRRTSFRDITHPDDRAMDNSLVQGLLDGKAHSFIEEKRYVRKDGDIVWVQLSCAMVRDDMNEPSHIVAVVQDVSERKDAEAARRHSETRFKDFAESASDWLWETDRDHRFTYFSADGSENPDPEQNTIFDMRLRFDHEEDKWARHRADLDARRPFRNFIFDRVGADGDVRQVRVSGAPVFDDDGNFLGYRGAGSDVTDLQRAERGLRALNQDLERRVEARTKALSHELAERERVQLSLRQSEERLRIVMDSTIDGIIVTNQSGIVESYSRSAMDMFGYAANEVIGNNISMLLPEPARKHHDGYLRNYLETGESVIIGVGREVVGQRKDGSTFPIEIGISEVDLGDDRLFTGTVRDITERKQVEQELIRARRAADAANDAKSQFLSSMSHELRTPLNAIMGFAQLLRDYPDTPLTEEQTESLNQILNGGQHLLGLVNEVLDLSRIEAGHIDLSFEAVDLAEVVRDSLILAQPLADDHRISIEVALGTLSQAMVTADPNRLKQVLLNLLSNAVKYNRDHGTVRIHAAESGDGMVRISVSDTGHGIAGDQRDEVFRPFSRLGMEGSQIEGTGIGLSVSRRLAESMAGSLDFESRIGKGSTFWIDIPLARQHGAK